MGISPITSVIGLIPIFPFIHFSIFEPILGTPPSQAARPSPHRTTHGEMVASPYRMGGSAIPPALLSVLDIAPTPSKSSDLGLSVSDGWWTDRVGGGRGTGGLQIKVPLSTPDIPLRSEICHRDGAAGPLGVVLGFAYLPPGRAQS